MRVFHKRILFKLHLFYSTVKLLLIINNYTLHAFLQCCCMCCILYSLQHLPQLWRETQVYITWWYSIYCHSLYFHFIVCIVSGGGVSGYRSDFISIQAWVQRLFSLICAIEPLLCQNVSDPFTGIQSKALVSLTFKGRKPFI